jgi:hypothetical protein
MLCDGSALDSKDPKYIALFSAIGQSWGNGSTSSPGARQPAIPGKTDFNAPDLRGYFLRGRDPGGLDRDPDSTDRKRTSLLQGGATGNDVGSYEADAFERHQHGLKLELASGEWHSYITNDWASITKKNPAADTELAGKSSETRPKNAAVNYYIKY